MAKRPFGKGELWPFGKSGLLGGNMKTMQDDPKRKEKGRMGGGGR